MNSTGICLNHAGNTQSRIENGSEPEANLNGLKSATITSFIKLIDARLAYA